MPYPQLVATLLGPIISVTLAGAAEVPKPRTEAPVRHVLLSNGAHRYAMTIQVGQTQLEAGLDTGSTGLRIMPGVLAPGDVGPGRAARPYQFDAGVRLNGRLSSGSLVIGDLSGRSAMEVVETVTCVEDHPHCPAARIPADEFRIQGDGLPNQGFRAILGVNMAEAEAPNPLVAMGVSRWIVELPRPGEQGPGRLVLNPSDAEVQGYVYLPLLPRYRDLHGGFHDAVAGCLRSADGRVQACGAVMLDCGAPGISVHNAGFGQDALPNGSKALLIFGDLAGRAQAMAAFTVGEHAHASHLEVVTDAARPETRIYAGLTPYYGFSVLYDPLHNRIGLKPRPLAPGGVQASLTPSPG